jgi:catechol 2,3-dioxygenase-like lactoylglutathione lyase family enzyme
MQSAAPTAEDNMITSIHTLIYSDDANATRAFLRDVLGWKYVAEDWDNDWLIFKSGYTEMGVHPTHSVWECQTYDHPRHHSVWRKARELLPSDQRTAGWGLLWIICMPKAAKLIC